MSLDDLKREALKLSFDEREELARTLNGSLDDDDEMAPGLPAEVRRRHQAYKEGKTKPISLEELLAGID